MEISLLNTYRAGVSSYPSHLLDRSIYEISGQVQKQGIPNQTTVDLYLKKTKQLIATIVTDKNGCYSFTSLKKTMVYFVVAFDSQRQYNAVIQDNVVPK